MNIRLSRFYLSVMGVVFLAMLSAYSISKGDAVTPPLCVTGIGTIIGGYQWGKSYTNAKFIQNNNNSTQ
jgi:hypothetical protein